MIEIFKLSDTAQVAISDEHGEKINYSKNYEKNLLHENFYIHNNQSKLSSSIK